MNSIRRERKKDVTAVSNQECILREGRRVPDPSKALTPLENLPMTTKSLEAVIGEVATPVWRAEGEEIFDGFIKRPVWE